ncbi:MAG: hypothetical protein VXW87_03715 [Pseudomonadota bacterium]|nr:hypothetical protein [Pseudomonadota bacterium]
MAALREQNSLPLTNFAASQLEKEVPYHTELVEERIEDIQAYDDRLVYFSSLGGVFNLNF